MEKNLNLNFHAKLSGLCYVLLFLCASFANFMVLEELVVFDDPSLTIQNISENDFTFRLGTFFFFIIAVLDVVVAWSLYYLFKEIDPRLSLLSAWSRLAYTVVLIFLVACLSVVSYLVSHVGLFGDISGLVMMLFALFNYGWIIGLSIFGLHLILLGVLFVKSKVISSFLGVLLMIAGSAYIFDTLANILFAQYAVYKDTFMMIVAVPAIIGEFSFLLWLLIKGFSKKKLKV